MNARAVGNDQSLTSSFASRQGARSRRVILSSSPPETRSMPARYSARAAAALTLAIGCMAAMTPARAELPTAGCPLGYAPAGARCVSESGRDAIEAFRPIQAIRYVLGSKRVMGYFTPASGECRVTLMLAEDMDPMMSEPLSAARLVVSLRPGQSASVGSAEAETMQVTCQGAAHMVEVKRHAPDEAYAMRRGAKPEEAR